jgi:hypothetical protein
MRMRKFLRLLEAYGADERRWPGERRAAVRRAMADDPAARAARDAAARLDARLARLAVPRDPAAEARILARLAHLPRQRGDLAWLPAVLSRSDLTPAWPRVVALATVAMLGVLMGFSDADMLVARPRAADLSALVFDPGPVVGLGLGAGVPQ